MSTDRDTTRIVRSWLMTDENESADRVLDAVLVALDTTPQRRATWWPARRLPTMNRFLGAGFATAAVVVIAAVIAMQALGLPDVGGPGQVEQPSPSPTRGTSEQVESPFPTIHPNVGRALEARTVRNGPLDSGDYTHYAVDGTLTNVMFSVPTGWEWDGSRLIKTGLGDSQSAAIAFLIGQVQVYTDPCHWAGAEPDPPTGGSVRDLVTALAAQPRRSATVPIDRGASGLHGPNAFAGMAVELIVPDDIDLAECDLGEFRTWGPKEGARGWVLGENARYDERPGQRHLVWVVDSFGNGVDAGGTRLIIDAATFPGTPVDVMSEIDAILDSLVVGGWG